MRFLQVKGVGSISQSPDYIEIKANVSHESNEYEVAIGKANEKLNILKDDLATVNINRFDIKTVSFNVESLYESVRENDGNYKRVFKGFECRQDLKFCFDFKIDSFCSVINALAKSQSFCQFDIKFSVKDKEKSKQKLLQSAIKDAKKKAVIIAKESEVKLKNISNITYDFNNLKFESETDFAPKMFAARANSMVMDITPDDVKSFDYVTVVWEIE